MINILIVLLLLLFHISYTIDETCIAYFSTHKLATHCIQPINQTIKHLNHTQYAHNPPILYLEFSILGLVFKTRQIHNPNHIKKKED